MTTKNAETPSHPFRKRVMYLSRSVSHSMILGPSLLEDQKETQLDADTPKTGHVLTPTLPTVHTVTTTPPRVVGEMMKTSREIDHADVVICLNMKTSRGMDRADVVTRLNVKTSREIDHADVVIRLNMKTSREVDRADLVTRLEMIGIALRGRGKNVRQIPVTGGLHDLEARVQY